VLVKKLASPLPYAVVAEDIDRVVVDAVAALLMASVSDSGLRCRRNGIYFALRGGLQLCFLPEILEELIPL
jgi:hypothetical protein